MTQPGNLATSNRSPLVAFGDLKVAGGDLLEGPGRESMGLEYLPTGNPFFRELFSNAKIGIFEPALLVVTGVATKRKRKRTSAGGKEQKSRRKRKRRKRGRKREGEREGDRGERRRNKRRRRLFPLHPCRSQYSIQYTPVMYGHVCLYVCA